MNNKEKSLHHEMEGFSGHEQPLNKKVESKNKLFGWWEVMFWNRINIEIRAKEKDGKREFLDNLYYEINISITDKTAERSIEPNQR